MNSPRQPAELQAVYVLLASDPASYVSGPTIPSPAVFPSSGDAGPSKAPGALPGESTNYLSGFVCC